MRLRGGELTPARAGWSVAVGLAVGVTPLWGLHWAILLAVCLPLRLDTGAAWVASNVSLPFIAPFITFAEIQLGARILRGAWLDLTLAELREARPAEVAKDLALGTALLAPLAGLVGGAAAYAVTRMARARSLQPPA